MGALEDFIEEIEESRFHDWEEIQKLISKSKAYLDYVKEEDYVLGDLKRQVDNGYKTQAYLNKKRDEMEKRVHKLHEEVIEILRSIYRKIESDKSVSKKEYNHLHECVTELMVGYLR